MVFKAASQTDFLLRSDANLILLKAFTMQVFFDFPPPFNAKAPRWARGATQNCFWKLRKENDDKYK
tara:strand:- start:58 stop:255 length:198 start_codon:yes stop_codon:yes gene_type:complete